MLHVNGEPIEESQIEAEYQRLKPEYDRYMSQRNEAPDDDRLREWARESVIERTLLHQAAAKTELPDSENADDGNAPDEQAVIQQKVRQLLESVTGNVPAPTDEQVQSAYEANQEHFRVPEQVHAAHIVKHTEAGVSNPDAYGEILNIRERIRKGESFEALASEHSDCSDNAGDLGTFPRGQMVQEFEDVVFALEENGISEVFQTPFGYHIAKLYKKTEATVAPLEQVRERLAHHLQDASRRQAMDAYVDSLKKEATIEERPA